MLHRPAQNKKKNSINQHHHASTRVRMPRDTHKSSGTRNCVHYEKITLDTQGGVALSKRMRSCLICTSSTSKFSRSLTCSTSRRDCFLMSCVREGVKPREHAANIQTCVGVMQTCILLLSAPGPTEPPVHAPPPCIKKYMHNRIVMQDCMFRTTQRRDITAHARRENVHNKDVTPDTQDDLALSILICSCLI